MLRREVRRGLELGRTTIRVWTTGRRLSRPDQVVQAEADLGTELGLNFLLVIFKLLGELGFRIIEILRATTDSHKGAFQQIQGLLVALPGVKVLDLLQLR